MVRVLAAAGADIAVHYRSNPQKAKELCWQVEALGRRACAVHAAIDDQRSVSIMGGNIASALGPVDIVVANAVQQYEWKSVMDQDVSDYESQYRTCVLQNVLLAKTFVPAMAERGWGRVIAISSVCAMECALGQSAYDSGKRGMDGVLRVLAREVGPSGITVVS
jgi:3-oxoacyl-[acyl-carrier protein] reductase